MKLCLYVQLRKAHTRVSLNGFLNFVTRVQKDKLECKGDLGAPMPASGEEITTWQAGRMPAQKLWDRILPFNFLPRMGPSRTVSTVALRAMVDKPRDGSRHGGMGTSSRQVHLYRSGMRNQPWCAVDKHAACVISIT